MTFRLSLISLGLAAWLTTSAFAADVEVLARGPVHEGYAEPSEREPTATPVVPKEPPKPIEELPPDQKPAGDNVQWIPGYFAWDEEKKDYIWISGFWRNAPPGRTWVPGSWRKAADGWQWSGGFWADAKGGNKAQMEYLPEPPKPLDEKGATTPQPSDNHVYVPGTWVWRDRYVWQPGFWAEYRQGWVWIPAHYRWTPAGYIFINGYWDYPLAERGLLFAPAYIPPEVYVAPAYVYTPTVVVREECLFGAFFWRRGFGCYYFGDYFAPSYASIGFVSWCGIGGVSIAIGGWHDPLFSYYRCGFRHDPFWRGGIHDLYAGRYRGDYMRPPHTLVQQKTVINNITNINNSKNINLNNVTMVSSLNDVQKSGRRNLQSVSEADRQAQQTAARGVRDVANRRATAETELAAKPGGKSTPRSLTLDVPQQSVTGRTGTASRGADLTPRGPKPAAIGSADPKTTGSPKTDRLPRIDPTLKGTNKTPETRSLPHTDPKLPGINPLPKGNATPRLDLPKGPGNVSPRLDLPKGPGNAPVLPKPATLAPPKSSGSPPAKSPPAKGNKTSLPTPPIGATASSRTSPFAGSAVVPRSAPPIARAAAPAAIRPTPYVGRSVTPRAISRSAPRPAAPAYSRPAASVRPPASATHARPAMSKKGNR